MNIKTILAVLAGMLLASCAKDIIEEGTLVKRNSSLTIEVTDEFAAATRADYSGFPSTSFETGDAIGIYAFDGSSYVASNIRFVRQSDGSWLPDEEIPYVEGNTYYAYFPYRATTYTPATSGTVDDIDAKFALFISDASNYFWKMDQSTKADFTYSNLMIAKGTITGTDGDEVTVKFTMHHKRGLAVANDIANKWYYSNAPETKYSPTVIFNTYVPYQMNGTYYFLVKPNRNTFFVNNTVNLPAGKYKEYEIKLKDDETYNYNYQRSDDQGETWYVSSCPNWLTLSTDGNEEFVVTTSNIRATNIFLDTQNENPNTALLKTATPVTNVDLSMVDNAGNARALRTTANSYLVHAPGSYRLPLVYGNAIKNGSTNSQAYHSTTNSDLVNHADAVITDPWLKNNGATPNGAQLVWQDVKNMISSVGIDGDYLTFTVDEDNIEEGNAVIAATMNGTIVWSWHIWVTPETLSGTVAVETDTRTYNVAPVNVGWVNPSNQYKIYAGSMCKIQARTNSLYVTLEFQVTQPYVKESQGVTLGHNPYFQWGRKDPEIPACGSLSNFNNHNTWDIEGNAITTENNNQITVATGAYSIGNTIQNPIKHYYNSNGYKVYSVLRYNFWNIDNTSTGYTYNTTIKTVYDPCPPDFCVPTAGLFFWCQGKTTQYDSTMKGVLLTYNSYNLFFPYITYRTYIGSLYSQTTGCWWTNELNWKEKGFTGSANSNNNIIYGIFETANAFSVRPVVEE